MEISILKDKSEQSSLSNMATACSKALGEYGITAHKVTTVADAAQFPLCLNMMFAKIPNLIEQMRYSSLQTMINWYTRNPDVYSIEELAYHLAVTRKYPMILESRYQAEVIDKSVKTIFSMGVGAAIRGNQHKIIYGVSPEFKDEGENDPDLFVVPYNRVTEHHKQIKKHVQVSNKVKTLLSKDGKNTRHLFVLAKDLGGAAKMGNYKGHPYEIVDQPDWDTYVEWARQYGIFISTAKSECFGIYYLELLASGVVGVFLDQPWVRFLLPDYPFIGKDAQEVMNMTVYVNKNYAEAKDKVNKYFESSKVMEQYSVDRFHAQLADLIKETHP